MKKYIVSSDKNVIVDSEYEESDYYGEYSILVEKSNFVSNIIIFNTKEAANLVLNEHRFEDNSLEVKKIEI